MALVSAIYEPPLCGCGWYHYAGTTCRQPALPPPTVVSLTWNPDPASEYVGKHRRKD